MQFLTQAWTDLGLDAALLDRVEPVDDVPLVARTAVGELAADAVAAASLAATALVAQSSGGAVGSVRVDPTKVAATFAADRYFRLDGAPVSAFAPLSGFWPAGDGWVRTHANYPHHAARLLAMLGLPDDADQVAVAAALAEIPAPELEARAAQARAIVSAVRTAEQWAAEAPAQHLAGQPLIRSTPTAARSAARLRPVGIAGARPLAGVRVLDLTRVLAGPVASRMLAFAGADVLRVDSPRLPEISWQHLDTGQGKRSTLLDLDSRADRDTFDGLLRAADVLVTGYRPGALARFGLGDDDLVSDHPGLVVGRVSAWGTDGPWAARRGFDSIVQAAIGIADLEQGSDGRPGALPAQALDHASGYLLAAGILAALGDVAGGGPARRVDVTLARVGMALLGTATSMVPVAVQRPDVELQTGTGADGTVECALPAVVFPAAPRRWDSVGHPWGTDAPRWR